MAGTCECGNESSVFHKILFGTATTLRTGESKVRILVRARDFFFLLKNIHIVSGTQ